MSFAREGENAALSVRNSSSPRISRHAPRWPPAAAGQFSELPTSVNTVLTFVPTVETAVMMATAISDAIKAYSIAVAPRSSPTKPENIDMTWPPTHEPPWTNAVLNSLRRLATKCRAGRLRELPTSVNTVLTFVPTVETAVMMATAISDAIRAYSIAVAPDSSRTKCVYSVKTDIHYI